MTTRRLLLCGFAVAALYLSPRPAGAMTEFCPARVERVLAWGVPAGSPKPTGSDVYAYQLEARSPRVITAATVVADTDRGWYGWKLSAVTISSRGVMRSRRLRVTFPQAVLVRHAWITSASEIGKTGFKWDDDATYACEVPSYAGRGAAGAEIARPQARASANPSLAPAAAMPSVSPSSMVTAQPAAPPFENIDCPVPFRQARPAHAVAPEYPGFSSAFSGVVRVTIDLDDSGHLIDSAVFQSSGNAAFDAAAWRAARESTYEPAVSYCQKVVGEYLFVATFNGR